MAIVTTHRALEAPNDVMWLTGPTLVADAETYSFASPFDDYVVVVSGSDFTYDETGQPVGGTYHSIEMFADPELRTLISQIYGLESSLATFSSNYIDDLAAAGVVAETPTGSFGSDTFVFTPVASGQGTADNLFDTIEFAAFTPQPFEAGDEVGFHIQADVLAAGDGATHDTSGSYDFGPIVVSSGDGLFE